jgi:hypothetical protein
VGAEQLRPAQAADSLLEAELPSDKSLTVELLAADQAVGSSDVEAIFTVEPAPEPVLIGLNTAEAPRRTRRARSLAHARRRAEHELRDAQRDQLRACMEQDARDQPRPGDLSRRLEIGEAVEAGPIGLDAPRSHGQL